MEYVLETQDLCKRYGSFHALSGLTMAVPKGAIYGLVGRNGAGKTTAMRILCGLQMPTSGQYRLFGCPGTSRQGARARRRIGAVVEEPAVYPDLTGGENLEYQARVLGLPDRGEAGRLLSLVGLSDAGGKKVRNYSLGMKQRLGIALALAGDPDLLVLDEPMNGLDPQGIIEVRELILRLNRERGITMLLSSHILDELSKVATHYGFLDSGRMLRQISAQELERTCRKCLRLTVSDTLALSRALEKLGAEYTVLSDTQADVYARLNISKLTKALEGEGCELVGVQERDESLETFYVNLMGGERHD